MLGRTDRTMATNKPPTTLEFTTVSHLCHFMGGISTDREEKAIEIYLLQMLTAT